MKKLDVIFLILFILILLGCGYIIYYLQLETTHCLKNPFVYGAIKMGNVSCSCFQAKSDTTCFPRFNFNDKNFTSIPRECSLV